MSSTWNVKVGDTATAAKGAEALVLEANAEREGRRADRLRIRAIVRIQSALRAHRERSNVMNKVRDTFVPVAVCEVLVFYNGLVHGSRSVGSFGQARAAFNAIPTCGAILQSACRSAARFLTSTSRQCWTRTTR